MWEHVSEIQKKKTALQIILIFKLIYNSIFKYFLLGNTILKSFIHNLLFRDVVVSWEPEGRYHHSKMFCWEPEGYYHHRLCKAIAPFWSLTEHLWILIAPFWFSTEHLWILIAPFWLSPDVVFLHFKKNTCQQTKGDYNIQYHKIK